MAWTRKFRGVHLFPGKTRIEEFLQHELREPRIVVFWHCGSKAVDLKRGGEEGQYEVMILNHAPESSGPCSEPEDSTRSYDNSMVTLPQ